MVAKVALEHRDEFERVMEADVIGQRHAEDGCTFTDMFRTVNEFGPDDTFTYVWAEGWMNGEAQEEHALTAWFRDWAKFNDAGKFQNLNIHWAFGGELEHQFDAAKSLLIPLGDVEYYDFASGTLGADPSNVGSRLL